MMTRYNLFRCFALVFLTGAVCIANLTAADSKRKVLYFSLSAGYEHSTVVSKDGKPSVSDNAITEVCKTAGIEVVCTKDGSVFDKDLSQYDAFLFQTSGDLSKGAKGHPDWALTATGWKNLVNAVRSGKGFVGFHPSTDSNRTGGDIYQSTPPDKITDYTRFIGAEFTVHGEHQEGTVNVIEPTPFPWFQKSGKSYRIFEEWYVHKNYNSDLHVFAVLDTAGMKGKMYNRPPVPIVWGRKEGSGRVLYSSFGHYDKYWQDKDNIQLVVQLIQAACGDLKTDLTPNIQTAAPEANVLLTKEDNVKIPYRVVDFTTLAGVPCPCGTSRRGLIDEKNFPGTIHRTDVDQTAKAHYHKTLTEVYYVISCEPGSVMQIDGKDIPLHADMAFYIPPGTVHCLVGKAKTFITVLPKFDPTDEYFPDKK
ncbi:MAG: ThuA domain-containing protein [Planctomycetaceae bacterium]|jgi:type 1 glutamine amidotransferase/quercetin dioxygenase-like cupin family protein|nr:ThuA domain-containing protein [Planctomycetaceae bacterium]